MRLGVWFFIAIALSLSFTMLKCSSVESENDDAMDIADDIPSSEYDQQSDDSSANNDDQSNNYDNDQVDSDYYDANNPPGITAKCIFPKDTKPGAIYAGKPRPVVVGIENQLSTGNNYWVHYIYASLYHPKNKNRLLQNMTATKYVQPVLAQSGTTFNYMIWLHDSFAEKNFTLTIFAHMTDDKHEYIYAVYNETVQFMEIPENTFDLKFLFMILVLTTTTVMVSKLLNTKSNQRKPTQTRANLEKVNVIDEDWLPQELKKKNKLASEK